MINQDDGFRIAVLRAHGATAGEVEELLAYTHNAFEQPAIIGAREYPLPDEPFVAAWERYAVEAERIGVCACLRRLLIQLRFPVAAGMSASDAYRAAIRRGVVDTEAAPSEGLHFVRPDGLRLLIHPTAVGRIPVVIADLREDFISLIQSIVHSNEPVPIPDSMGACIVAGYNNWDRIAQLRVRWEHAHPDERSTESWVQAFRGIVSRKELYQDRFILLSSGPYSAVSAEALGLGEEEWLAASLVIRLEHECTHYFTRRAFGSMRNSLLDELIADYMGIVAAVGRYRSDWLLRFMGLESYPCYRPGGRLGNYRGDPPLSDGAFAVLQSLVKSAAEHLESFESGRLESCDAGRLPGGRGLAEGAAIVTALARLGLEALASDDAVALIGAIVRGADQKMGVRVTVG
jgi:hypothetical protein